jgi:hypothetical protein
MFVGREGYPRNRRDRRRDGRRYGRSDGRQGGARDREQLVWGMRRGLPLEYVEVENVGTCYCQTLPLSESKEEVKGDGVGT